MKEKRGVSKITTKGETMYDRRGGEASRSDTQA